MSSLQKKNVRLPIARMKRNARTELTRPNTKACNKKRVIFKTFSAIGCRKLNDVLKLSKLKVRSGRIRN